MQLARGAALSLGCAIAGAAVWGAISVATDMRLGLLAIVVGGLAGFGMGYGNRGRGGVAAGVLAACITLVAVVASRGVVTHIAAAKYVRENAMTAREAVVEEFAAEVYAEMESSGVEMTETEEGYPPEVMVRAQRRWDALPTDEQLHRLSAAEEELRQGGQVATGVLTVIGLLFDFGLFGFVFVILAMTTAYQCGAKRLVKTESGWAEATEVLAEPAPANVEPSRGFFAAAERADDEDPLERLKRMREKSAAAGAAKREGEETAVRDAA